MTGEASRLPATHGAPHESALRCLARPERRGGSASRNPTYRASRVRTVAGRHTSAQARGTMRRTPAVGPVVGGACVSATLGPSGDGGQSAGKTWAQNTHLQRVVKSVVDRGYGEA